MFPILMVKSLGGYPVNNVTNMSYMLANAYVFDSFVQDWLVVKLAS